MSSYGTLASVAGNQSDVGERARKARRRDREAVLHVVAEAEAARCSTYWPIFSPPHYWRAVCILARGHDGRCVDQRGRRGPA